MTMLDTFDHTDFAAAGISRKLRGTVSVVIPTRNTAGTIAATVAELMILAEDGLISQILVVDADSPDGTADLARNAGAEVFSENELVDGFGPARGKGDAMWRALAAVTGDIVVYIDGDIADFGRHYITGLVGPLADPGKQFVKGRYQRPFRYGENEEPSGGGRVTELAARPLLARLAPELLAFDQPLAGEVAARRELLERIPFACGYGVEIAMLLDVWDQVGIESMAQVELGTKRNAHQSLAALNGMSTEVIAGLAAALDRLDRDDTGRMVPAEGTGPEVTLRPAFATVKAV
ncbi:MAG: Glucosyl-3-phosphoglycerate synthase [Actinomycetota bacterium]|jgi:glucosyl-3-phosphoglycerate synthase|nr:Glucosyl-3-phosphoglycerate synthase [Actinomycetota bacterium]